MDVDDEFGDLYTDIGPEIGKNLVAEPLVSVGDGDLYDEDDEELLYGTSSSSLVALSSKPPSLPASTPRRSGIQLALTAKDVDHDELLLYGQLYGVSTEKPVRAESPLRDGEIKAISDSRVEKRQDSREDAKSVETVEESSFGLLVEERTDSAGDMLGMSAEIPLGVVGVAAGSGDRAIEKEGLTSQGRTTEVFGSLSAPSDVDPVILRRGQLVSDVTRLSNSPPGHFIEEDEEGREMGDEWEGGVIEGGEEDLEVEAEDWDSDSEDDIQIVLNDETPAYPAERPGDGDELEGSEDEDEEDLVIVMGDDDDALPIEEQEWEEQAIPMDALPGALGASLSLGSDRAPGGEDRGQAGKGSGGSSVSSGVPRIGYSGQNYHTHHMQYKYVRPGAGAGSAMAPPPTQGSPQAGVPSGRGIGGGSSGGWGSGRGVGGRGDWAGGGGRGPAGQRPSQGSGGMSSWGASRGFPSGIEFNLPPTKTVFDVDLDTLEEKPWRRPGVDITDFFNFSFTENSWKQYCRQLAQLRLEATMQSKIRVYESGRSEQEYDPDLPPELAAVTGMQEASDPNLPQLRQQDTGLGAGPGRGRGLGRGRMMPPAGRAIQVEGGGGERRPSADVRRQRSRDSDAIVLQDASEDEPPASVPGEGNEEFPEEDEERGGAIPEKEGRFFRTGAPAPWEIEGPPSMWERENMPMGLGPMPNMMSMHAGGMMPGHRMDLEGPGPFPVGPGMPMHPPGPGPNFGMFPGTPFGPPPVGRPPLYNAPRPGLPLPVPVPPPDSFPPMMVPLEYHEPPRRRTPPHLTPPRRTPSQGPPVDWDDDLSNGSGVNWIIREGRSHREPKDFDGSNGDWHADDMERREGSYTVRFGRENDRPSLRERSVDEASAEGRSEDHNRSISRERVLEDNEWDGGHGLRIAKKQKVHPQVEARLKSGREGYSHSKAVKSNVRKEPSHSWEPSKEHVTQGEDISQQRRYEAIHSKATERKGPLPGEDSLTSQRKELGWNDRQDMELKDRRQPREREEVQRRKVKEDDTHQHRTRDDLERGRHRDDQERRHLKKDKEEERTLRDDRSRRHEEDHGWASRERDETLPREDFKSVSTEREPEHSKEKRKREDRGKLRTRLDDFREADGRLKGRLEDPRENDGRGKGRLDDHREMDGRLKGRLDDLRETDGRVKGRFEDVRESDGRGKGWFDDVRESDGRVKGRIEDVRERDGRTKGRFEDVRESEGRSKVRLEDARETEGRARGRLEDCRESDGRGKGSFEDTREPDGRSKARSEDFRDSDGRVKTRFEDHRESDGRMKVRKEDFRESEGRVKGRSDDLREKDGRVKSRLEEVRDGDGRAKGRLEEVRDGDGRAKGRLEDMRESSDGRLKRRMDDLRESAGRLKGRLDDLRESDVRGKVRPDEGRESDGRGRRYDKEDDLHTWDDRRNFEEKSSRGESTHVARNHSAELRKMVDDQRPHKDKRGWEGSVAAKETRSERNGSLPGLGEDKSYRSHADGSKKRRVEEYRTSAQFDKASTRDSDDLAATGARQKEKRVVVQKRVEDQFARRTHEKDVAYRQHRMSKNDNVLSFENGSSEEEADYRGRSKLERWMSRKERDAIMGGGSMQKWQSSESGHEGHEEAPSTSQHTISERKQQSRTTEQHWKEDRKEKQRLTTHSGKRHFDSEVKEPPLVTHGSGGGGDSALEPTTAGPKDVAEKRKERLERLRLQAEEVAAKRQKNEASVPQAGSVEEVKQERPARKRRWGNG